MKIDLKKIPSDGLRLETSEPIELEGLSFPGPVGVNIEINKAGNTLLVSGDIKTEIELLCSKCSKKYNQILEDNRFNITCDVTGKTEIDLTPDIWEGVIILIPLKPLCRKGCRGLCPKCGQDLNEKQCPCDITKPDTRWDGLGRINL